MILIPQLWLKSGKAILPEGSSSAIFTEDPLSTASAIKACGVEAITLIDLSIPHVGQSPDLQLVKKIKDETGLSISVGGAFRSEQPIEGFLAAGADFIILGTVAYQQPAFLESVAKRFPGRIATQIDMRGGRVTIPGYAVVSNKTVFDYAEQFLRCGVRHILYSDVGTSGHIADENDASMKAFCQKVLARVFCASELSSIADVERIARLGVPKLDGIILGKALYDGRIDLRGAVALVRDLALVMEDDSTMAEM